MVCKHFFHYIFKRAHSEVDSSISNTNNSTCYESFVCTQLNGYTYDLLIISFLND